MGQMTAKASHLGKTREGELSSFELDLSDESDGTRKLMALSPAIESALKKGGVLLVDEIGQALVHLLSEEATYLKIATTLLHVIEALVISAVIGIAVGLAEGADHRIYAFFRPFMVLIRSLPMIVMVILVMSMISYRSVPVVAGSVILIPLFSEAVYEGSRALDPELIDVYRMNSGFNLRVAFQVYLPLISGYLKQAFVNAAGNGIKVAVSAEYLVQTKNSLGKAVYSSGYFSEYAEIYAYALIMIFLVLMITELPGRLVKLKTQP